MTIKELSAENLLNLLDRRLQKHQFVVRYGAVILARNGEYKRQRYVRLYHVQDIVRKPPDFPAPKLGLGGIEED